MEVFDKNRFIYGYKNIDIDDIFHVFEKDISSYSLDLFADV